MTQEILKIPEGINLIKTESGKDIRGEVYEQIWNETVDRTVNIIDAAISENRIPVLYIYSNGGLILNRDLIARLSEGQRSKVKICLVDKSYENKDGKLVRKDILFTPEGHEIAEGENVTRIMLDDIVDSGDSFEKVNDLIPGDDILDVVITPIIKLDNNEGENGTRRRLKKKNINFESFGEKYKKLMTNYERGTYVLYHTEGEYAWYAGGFGMNKDDIAEYNENDFDILCGIEAAQRLFAGVFCEEKNIDNQVNEAFLSSNEFGEGKYDKEALIEIIKLHYNYKFGGQNPEILSEINQKIIKYIYSS